MPAGSLALPLLLARSLLSARGALPSRSSLRPAAGEMILHNPTKCGADADDGEVKYLTDGTYNRCFSVITPDGAPRPMPVLFWFHVAEGNATFCASNPLAALARQHGFALVCAEALDQEQYGPGGQWTVPEVQTSLTGTKCGRKDSPDIPYMENIIVMLNETGIYDTERLFFSGCSMGSAFSIYISQCLKSQRPNGVSSFATHSTGLKVKGDGNTWPASIYHPEYVTAECQECQYFPIVPTAFTDDLGLKACIFDGTADPSAPDPFFYRSSVALSNVWSELGMAEEHIFTSGGHCEEIPYEKIISCLDDGTGRLLLKNSEDSLRQVHAFSGEFLGHDHPDKVAQYLARKLMLIAILILAVTVVSVLQVGLFFHKLLAEHEENAAKD